MGTITAMGEVFAAIINIALAIFIVTAVSVI